MPHIHTQPNQHDMTVSAYIVFRDGDEWKCLAHYHKKMDVIMQTGGHIELDQTPWQAIASEITEETGLGLAELEVLQPTQEVIQMERTIAHPVPFHVNTHAVGDDHYHSDLCYGFISPSKTGLRSIDGESDDLRWLTLDELQKLADEGEALRDVYDIYDFLIRHLGEYASVPSDIFSLGKPAAPSATYRRGKPSDFRS